RCVCRDANEQRAVVALRAELDAAESTTVRLRTTVAGRDHEDTHTLAAGENRVEWQVTVDDPQLWWPHALGEQPLHDLTVEVWDERDGDRPSDRRSLRTGLRQVRLQKWILHVNGERLFAKGAN